ncbi:adenylyltransferase/cytidyltransferase family protein [Gammaproteobacteria bacterium]|nr:adenylyltransferase/cytidyltransferase family protein [Gammaproteobacteria bacterium]
MKKIAIIGGTFDPIHLGHIALIQNAQTWFVDCRIAITYCSHLKQQAAPYHHRYRMCQKSIDQEFGGKVGIMPTDHASSFMIDNLHFFHKHFPEHLFYLILGSDCLNQIETWYRWQSLLDVCSVVIFERKGYPSKVPHLWQSYVKKSITENRKDKFFLLNQTKDIPKISSTECRLALKKARKEQKTNGLATYTRSYIDQHDLYR